MEKMPQALGLFLGVQGEVHLTDEGESVRVTVAPGKTALLRVPEVVLLRNALSVWLMKQTERDQQP
jgi:hypothetical protein